LLGLQRPPVREERHLQKVRRPQAGRWQRLLEQWRANAGGHTRNCQRSPPVQRRPDAKARRLDLSGLRRPPIRQEQPVPQVRPPKPKCRRHGRRGLRWRRTSHKQRRPDAKTRRLDLPELRRPPVRQEQPVPQVRSAKPIRRRGTPHAYGGLRRRRWLRQPSTAAGRLDLPGLQRPCFRSESYLQEMRCTETGRRHGRLSGRRRLSSRRRLHSSGQHAAGDPQAVRQWWLRRRWWVAGTLAKPSPLAVWQWQSRVPSWERSTRALAQVDCFDRGSLLSGPGPQRAELRHRSRGFPKAGVA